MSDRPRTHQSSHCSRRTLLARTLGLAVAVRAVGASARAQDDPVAAWPRIGDVLVKDGDATLTPLTPADLTVGAGPIFAWAMEPGSRVVRKGSRLNLLLVVRLDEGGLAHETRARAADGVVVYTAICPHAGCEVEGWLPDEQVLDCECHASRFDPKDGARVIDGPAPRPLPSLPIGVVEGRLVVAQPFTAKVGFEPGM